MKWYVARIVMKCVVGEDDPGPWTLDEQIRVIQAKDSGEAYRKALAIGFKEEHEYLNCDDEVVRWIFAGLADLNEMLAEEIEDGTEITNFMHETSDISEFLMRRDDLTVFWSERNKHKTARELLDERHRRRAPR